MAKLFTELEVDSKRLFPFTQIRSPQDLIVGILTISEKWDFLSRKGVKPTKQYSPYYVPFLDESGAIAGRELNSPWELVFWNDWAIREDFKLISNDRISQPIPVTVTAINPDQIFIEPGARIQYCTLNASTGPIYIGSDAEIMEGSLIRGPFSLGASAVVKMGAKIYGATSIGPYSVVGGELKNVLMMGYSNKGHDGYLGDSVIGEWCNLGAGTSNSNVKNSAGVIKTWNMSQADFIETGNKCGLLMGDYSRSAINSSFNTGTIVGICCNTFFIGLSPKFIPNFSWGDGTGIRYEFDKAMNDIGNWKKFKNKTISEQEIQILKSIFDNT